MNPEQVVIGEDERWAQLPTNEEKDSPGSRPALPSTDRQLVRRAKKGERSAFAAIFRRYEQDLYKFCMAILGEPQDAQDALQNTMIKVLKALPGERREIALKPWLYRIAHNEAIEVGRRRRPTDPLENAPAESRANLAEQVEDRVRLRQLVADVSDLPERQRAILIMRELSGLEFTEIATALGTSPGAVRQGLYEARRNLQQMGEGREMECEAVTRFLSDEDRQLSHRRDVRSHLRGCSRCRQFEGEIGNRREALAAIAPLPALAAAALVKNVVGASGATATGTVALGTGVAVKSASVPAIIKASATVLAIATLGVAAVDRGGLLPTEIRQQPQVEGRSAVVAKRDLQRGENLARGAHPRLTVQRLEVAERAAKAGKGVGAEADARRLGARVSLLLGNPGENGAGEGPPAHSDPGTGPQAPTPANQVPAVRQPAHPEHPEHPAHPEHPEHPAQPEHPAHPETPQTNGGPPLSEAPPFSDPGHSESPQKPIAQQPAETTSESPKSDGNSKAHP